jgi:peptidoglycan hydrolase-like protein with peptidoglycan-binding domain
MTLRLPSSSLLLPRTRRTAAKALLIDEHSGLTALARRSRWLVLIALVAGCSSAGYASTRNTRVGPTTTAAPRTMTTIPPVHQPGAVTLPAPPARGISWGDRGVIVFAYERRLKQLHFDPGPVDGVYSPDTQYAVTAVEKLLGLPRDGVIGPLVELGLEHFSYRPAMPKAEGDRVEINLDTQVLTVYQAWQPILITTASTGSGEYFCGGTDGCQYAITPTGHFHLQNLHSGWDKGKLGRMWNPYYFNGGIAVHGLPSVPGYPASHGCVRIPMDIANYFPTLVTKGESVYVFGTAMKPGHEYIGPTPPTTNTTTTLPGPTTIPHTTTTIPYVTTTPPPNTVGQTSTTVPHTTTAPRTTTSTAATS